MSNDEFVKQKKSKGKKNAPSQPEPEIITGLQSQFAPLESLIVEPLEMPAPIQTKPKKISPLIRNAIKSQPEELQFKKVEVVKHTKETHEKDSDEEDLEDVEDVTTEEEYQEADQDYGMCQGCYHCNWTGVSLDGKADCRRHYYGDAN